MRGKPAHAASRYAMTRQQNIDAVGAYELRNLLFVKWDSGEFQRHAGNLP
jgi:hypothetical protein